jgi:hypothetical protein
LTGRQPAHIGTKLGVPKIPSTVRFFGFDGCGGEVLRGVEFKDHVVHVTALEHLKEGSVSEFHVEVTTNCELVTYSQPSFEVCL